MSVGRSTETVANRQDLAKDLSSLYETIQCEIRGYRREHEVLRGNLQQLVQQDEALAAGCHPTEAPDGFDASEYKRISDGVICNLRNQIQLIKEEKDTFESLWGSSQRTIRTLEQEIHEYRKQLKQPKSILDLRQQYTVAVQLLEQSLGETREKLNGKIAANKQLHDACAAANERLKTLEQLSHAQRDEHSSLRQAVEQCRETEARLQAGQVAAMREKAELEALLDKANALAKEHMSRENQALMKVQEALQIADTAIEEKNCVLLRERDVRDECDFLATTIGQVMEDAARKVELEMNAMKAGYENRIAGLEQSLGQVRSLLEQQCRKAAEAERCSRTLEEKFKTLIKTNQTLDTDLHAASKLIIEMELKLEAFQKTMAKERDTSRAITAREQELQQLLANNEQLKERWKREMLTVTDELHRKIETVRRENCKLTAENNQLKDQLLLEIGNGGSGGGDSTLTVPLRASKDRAAASSGGD